MGKGFNNYMTKKFFHPSSKENIKRVWMAQQKTTFEKKKQEDLMNQYQKEQDMLHNRALLGDEKAKLGLSFLYDPPPGLKNKEKEEDEPEYKFEWQRKFNAPREAYAKDDETIRDQPFGIEVRNVRCIKCRQWGHVNTDKICPLYLTNLTAEPPKPENSTSSLVEGLREEGFRFKESVLGKLMATGDVRGVSDSEDEDDPEVQFLKSLTPAQKKKLMKKLNKLQSGKKKSKKHKKKGKKSQREDSDSESSDDDRKVVKSRADGHLDRSRDGGQEPSDRKYHSSRDDTRARDDGRFIDRRDEPRMKEGRGDDRRDRERTETDYRRDRRDQYIMEREKDGRKEKKRHRYDSPPERERSVERMKTKRYGSTERKKIKKERDSSSDSDSSVEKKQSKKRREKGQREERQKVKKEYSSSSDSDSSLVREKSRKKNGKSGIKEEGHKVKKEYGSSGDSSPVRSKKMKGKSKRHHDSSSERDVSPRREKRNDRERNDGRRNKSHDSKEKRDRYEKTK